MKKIAFLGAPGVGKGTFISIIAPRLGFAVVGLGDLIRSEVSSGSVLGKELGGYSNQGKLAPDTLADQLVTHHLTQITNSGNRLPGFILDGYPRTLTQAKYLEKTAPVDRVMHIELQEWVAIKKARGRRICRACSQSFNMADIMEDGYDMPAILPDFDSCPKGPACPRELYSRDDDSAETIGKRMKTYQAQTAPLVDYYHAQGKLRSFVVRKGVKDADALMAEMLAD